MEPVFLLDERANKWKETEEWQRVKDEEMERDRQDRDRVRLAQEDLEIQQAREASVHHAQGVRKYKTLTIHPSTNPLTSPQSPRFSERLRPKRDASP